MLRADGHTGYELLERDAGTVAQCSCTWTSSPSVTPAAATSELIDHLYQRARQLTRTAARRATVYPRWRHHPERRAN